MMRSHNDAARMMGARTRAALGADSEACQGWSDVVPADAVRAMLADLVPFEELDSVMGGIAASADSMEAMVERCFDRAAQSFKDEGEDAEVDQVVFMARFLEFIGPSAFLAAGQEVAYALLMANARPELGS